MSRADPELIELRQGIDLKAWLTTPALLESAK